MTSEELRERLELGEDDRHEIKSVAHTDFDIDGRIVSKAIVALANSSGGRLILGAEDDVTPSGIGDRAQADALMRKVSRVCRDAIVPPIGCLIVKVRLGDVTLLVVDVMGFSPDRPYQASKYYIRDGAQSREATPSELRRLLQSADYHYDEETVRGSSYGELDSGAMSALLGQLYDSAAFDEREGRRYLRELKCLDDDGIPTITGLLFLGRTEVLADLGRPLRDARISAVCFPDDDIGDEMRDRREIGGRLPEQIEGALSFLERNLSAPASIAGGRRVEHSIPGSVLREAVVNAVTHRDYRPAAQTRIFVFPSRIEVHNPGELLNRLTIDNIRAGLSQRRNPVISSLLNRLERRESIGSGVPRMFRLMREADLPEPKLAVAGGEFKLTLRTRS